MAYNLPPSPDAGPDVGAGFPGGGFGIPGLGFGKHLNFDVGAGFGGGGGGVGGGPGFFGGGFPGWGTPYVPVTPLGGLWGFKGDLIVPMVAIGFALFILLLIVPAVKYAFAWKFTVLEDLAGSKAGKLLRRDVGQAPAEHLADNNLNRLADIVSAAIYSEGCSRRILCEIGAYSREGAQYSSLIRLLELVVPEDYHESFSIVRQASEGNLNCAENYPCGGSEINRQKASQNEIDVNGQSSKQVKMGGASNLTAATATPSVPSNSSADTTPAPSVFGKFKRAIM